MQIIATAIIKGGTGKTATAAALAQAAQHTGKRVLVIDLDPQANLTLAIGARQQAKGSYSLITGAADATACTQQTEQGIDVIAAAPELATIRTTPASATRLRAAIQPIKEEYDFIVIDTPPTIGEMLYSALHAATGLVIPLETDSSSLQGLYQITDIAKQIQQRAAGLQILGTVITKYDSRPKINRFIHDAIEAKGAEIGAPLLAEIRAGVAVREAAAMKANLFEYAPKSNPAKDYMKLYKTIAEREI